MVTSSLTIDEIDEAKEREDLKILEAVFFVSGRFLNIQELISLSDLNPIIIKDLIEKLKEKYDSEDSSIEIVEKNGLWKMDVKPDYEHLVNKLATGSSEFTKAEQETLAIIAFKQPIKQSVIIKIRGNKAYDHIKKFAGLGLIKKKKMGHTHELSLSDDFYDYFNISESERQNVPEMNAKIKQQIESAEKEVEVEESALETMDKLKVQLGEESASEKGSELKKKQEKNKVVPEENKEKEDFVEEESEGKEKSAFEELEEIAEENEEAERENEYRKSEEKAKETSEEKVPEKGVKEKGGFDKEYEKVKKQLGASSDEFDEPARGYVEEVENESTEEIIAETAPKKSSSAKEDDSAEEIVEDLVEKSEEEEKTFDALKKMS
jgi:segregation and condensation protein B